MFFNIQFLSISIFFFGIHLLKNLDHLTYRVSQSGLAISYSEYYIFTISLYLSPLINCSCFPRHDGLIHFANVLVVAIFPEETHNVWFSLNFSLSLFPTFCIFFIIMLPTLSCQCLNQSINH